MSEADFRMKLEHLINCESRENGSNTPHWILAEYLIDCLKAFDASVLRRETWYGRSHSLIQGRPAAEGEIADVAGPLESNTIEGARMKPRAVE
jgi:hypothetical protein